MDIYPEKALQHPCRYCGMPVGAALYVSEHYGCCCEGCYLNARMQFDVAATSDAAQFALAESLAAALDAREHETGLHSKRVACHTLVLAKHFTADAKKLQQVYWGALLHDIGKIGIPDAILLKNGSLTEMEWQVMRTHPEIGHRILSCAPSMTEAATVVLNHEERFDGSGYPSGLVGEAIPLWARLFAVIDTLDAMTSDRPYRKGFSFDAACTDILQLGGTQFDPNALDVFVAERTTLRSMVELKCEKPAVHDMLPA